MMLGQEVITYNVVILSRIFDKPRFPLLLFGVLWMIFKAFEFAFLVNDVEQLLLPELGIL